MGRQKRIEFSLNKGSSQGRFAEFFAGIGLVRMGLEQGGWELAWANDIDPKKCRMYDAHFGDAGSHFVLDDIHEVDADSIPDIDLATASFPCTDLSVAGGRRGLNSGESSAFWGFYRILEEMDERRPRQILVENVVGFLTSHGGADFQEAMQALNRLGYGIDTFVLDAKWFVPQSRSRLFVVGTQDADLNDEVVESRIRPRALAEFIRNNSEIDWAISSLPDPPLQSGLELADILEDLPRDAPEWWSKDRVNYLCSQMSEKHAAIAEDMQRRRKWSYGTVFRRVRLQADGTKRSMGELRTDGIAGCLRTPKGGSGRQILFQAGFNNRRARLLTPTECARLMGADNFCIDESLSLNDALFGFGDAVCVSAIKWIADNCLSQKLSPLSTV